jgi:hypothetical protein
MKGFSQQEGIHTIETFTPVAKMNYVRLILPLIAWMENPSYGCKECFSS